MKDNPFRTILVAVFLLLAVGGVVAFALNKSVGNSNINSVGQVVIWGTMDQGVMNETIKEMQKLYFPKDGGDGIRYFQLDKYTYREKIVENIAIGNIPDLILIRQDDLLDQASLLSSIPFESYSIRRFKDTYIEGSEVYLHTKGVYALPLTVDPLVMYWNRDILSREGISTPPEYWKEFLTLSPKLTKVNIDASVSQATVALGEFNNVTNAKELISALIIQAGNPISMYDATGEIRIVLKSNFDDDGPRPAVEALRFYTDFSNPTKSVYSWNRAMSNSIEAFIKGDLVFYFGFASEIKTIRELNPNLNFDVAKFPQIEGDGTPATFGKMTAIGIPRASKNPGGAVKVAVFLTTDPVLAKLSEFTGLPPVSRKLLRQKPSNTSLGPIFYESALISHAWAEPRRKDADAIFKDMVESITSGRLGIDKAINDAHDKLTGEK